MDTEEFAARKALHAMVGNRLQAEFDIEQSKRFLHILEIAEKKDLLSIELQKIKLQIAVLHLEEIECTIKAQETKIKKIIDNRNA